MSLSVVKWPNSQPQRQLFRQLSLFFKWNAFVAYSAGTCFNIHRHTGRDSSNKFRIPKWNRKTFFVTRRPRRLRRKCLKSPAKRSLHVDAIETLLGSTCSVRLATVLRHVGYSWLKCDYFQSWAKDTQHVATHRVAKRTQQVASNNVGIWCDDMLRSFGRGLEQPADCAYFCFRKVAESETISVSTLQRF